jgi:fumarate reductase subunit D
MTPQIVSAIISVLSTFIVALLGAIWREMHRLNQQMQRMNVGMTTQNSRILVLERLADKLPCVRTLTCPKPKE